MTAQRSLFAVSLLGVASAGFLITRALLPALPDRAEVEAASPAVAVSPAMHPAPPAPLRAVAPSPAEVAEVVGVIEVAHDPPVAPSLDEPSTMARLRELWPLDPERTLALCDEAETQFKNSASAAERAWIRVRALVGMRRFEEARDHARILTRTHPGTAWASDVERHLLVYPLGQPSREELQAAAAR